MMYKTLEEMVGRMYLLHSDVSAFKAGLENIADEEDAQKIIGGSIELCELISEEGYDDLLRKVHGKDKDIRIELMVGSERKKDVLDFMQDKNSLMADLAEVMKGKVYSSVSVVSGSDSLETRKLLARNCLVYCQLVNWVDLTEVDYGLDPVLNLSISEAAEFNTQLIAGIEQFEQIVQDYCCGRLDKQNITRTRVMLKSLYASVKQLPRRFRNKGALKKSYDVSHWLGIFSEFDAELAGMRRHKTRAGIIEEKKRIDQRIAECDLDMHYIQSQGPSEEREYLQRVASMKRTPLPISILAEENRYLAHRAGICRELEDCLSHAVSYIEENVEEGTVYYDARIAV